MSILKLLSLLIPIGSVVITSCTSNASNISETNTLIVSNTKLPSATFTFVPKPTNTITNTPIPTISKTRFDLSPELYLDENSSRDNLQGEPYHQDYYNFSNGNGRGFIYHFQDEEWVTALTWTRILPFNDGPDPNEGELREHYIQVWKDSELIYSLPVSSISHAYQPERLLHYDDHWIFWFMDLNTNKGYVVQDGVLLNELHDYDSAFSIYLLDGKPFFFFKRENQFGISFNNQEILLPYSNIIYRTPCCESGGMFNPRATNIMISFYNQVDETKYEYIEIGLK